MVIIPLWIFFRLLTSVFIAFISSLHPMTLLEKSIPLIPPSLPLSTWLERTFLSPWLRWDVVWYQRIVVHGYNAENGTAQFHPLYPWLASLVSKLGVHPLFSLLLISSIASLGFLCIYYRLARLDFEDTDARFSLLVILLAPTAFVLFAPYSEALFLLCATSCLYFTRKQRLWLASITGALAVLTRQQGIFLFFPLIYEQFTLWVNIRHEAKFIWHKIFISMVIPASYAFWILYRNLVLGDNLLNFTNIQNFIYSLLITPSASKVVPQQSFIWPWEAIGNAFGKLIQAPDLDILVNITLAIHFIILFGVTWKNMRPAYRLYSIIITLVSFSYYTGPFHPYMGLPRHLLLAIPVFLYAAPAINRPIIRPIYLIVVGSLYLFLIFLFSLKAWVV